MSVPGVVSTDPLLNAKTVGNADHHKVIIMLIIFSSSFDTEIKLCILDQLGEYLSSPYREINALPYFIY